MQKTLRFRTRVLSIASGVMLVMAAGTAVQAGSEQAIQMGKKEFLDNCAACHRADAKGNGPLASELKKTPPDLTRIAIENGGTFPYGRVTELIDGRAEVLSHGSRDMPVWGSRFNEKGNSTVARGRILNLALFLESIQVKE